MSMVSAIFAAKSSRFPLAWLAVFFISGIVLSNYISLRFEILMISVLLSFLSTIIFFNKKFVLPVLLSSFFFLGAFCFEIEKLGIKPNRLKNLYDSSQLISGEPIEITGVSQSKPEAAVGGFFILVETENVVRKEAELKTSGTIRIFAPFSDENIAREYENLKIAYGTKIEVACELRREEKFLNPGVASMKEILDSQDIDAVCTLKSPLLINNLGTQKRFISLGWIYEQRQNLLTEFKNRFSSKTAGVLIASLLGNRYHLDKQTSESFREGGTFHILVISGLQITFIGAVLFWILRHFIKNRFLQFVFSSGILWAYTIAVGAGAPVVRAALMFTILHFAFVVYRQGNLLNALGASALVLLVWKPSEVFNQSFQLTFICVLAIVATAFPLLERFRAIGAWQPTIETPFPPKTRKNLKAFCEILYWSEEKWQAEAARNIWKCVLFKTTYAAKVERLKLQKISRYIFETLLVSVIVQIWLLPFSVIYFHRISLISVFLNIWVGLLMAIGSLTALSGVLSAQISETLAMPFIYATEILNRLIFSVTTFWIDFDWSSLRVPHYSGFSKIIYFLYFIPIIILTFRLYRWNPFKLVKKSRKNFDEGQSKFYSHRFWLKVSVSGFLLALLLIILHPFSAPQIDGQLRVDFLDVGQGDAALVTVPTGETILIDGGGRANFNQIYLLREGEEPEIFEPDVQNIGETVVSKFLWERGYDKIDYVLPTHADTDHLQGLTDVAKNFTIKAAILSRMPEKDEEFKNFQRVLEKKHIPVQILARGDILNFGEVKIEVLHPASDGLNKGSWENNQSTVLRIIYGDAKILLTGDIEKETEKELLNAPEVLQSNVVKVAHHGSKTSSIKEFVEATKAKIAVISVGRESPFGHPKPEIIARWRDSGAKVLTTGEKGTITVLTDGKQLKIETFLK